MKPPAPLPGNREPQRPAPKPRTSDPAQQGWNGSRGFTPLASGGRKRHVRPVA